MNFDRYSFSRQDYLDVYSNLVFPRLVEEKMLLLLRQGKISKWFSGIGQEGIAVGAAMAMHDDEYILPLHRNLGVFTVRNVDLARLFAQFMGKYSGFTKGRDRSFHFGMKDKRIVGMISHLGAQLSVADGVALASKLRSENKCVLVFSGEGGTSEGEFHEALNVAAVWKLPVIFLVENNGYALSTPVSEQYACDSITHKGQGYGIKAKKIDGNNVLEVYSEIKKVAELLREDPQPYLIEAMTFRMRGHEEASGIKYIPEELLKKWHKKDPVVSFENFLTGKKILTEEEMSSIKNSITRKITAAWKEAEVEPYNLDPEEEEHDVFLPGDRINTSVDISLGREVRYIDAINDALFLALEKNKDLVIMGQDIAEYGGAFKVTEGLVERFGKERIRNTPLCESAIVGAALGLSINGFKAVVEMQFADFVSCAFNQIVNNLAKSHYRWGENADVVVRMPTGAGTGAGPFHSQSTEAWFFHVPGLKIVYPSTPFDAKGLLGAAIEDPNPVLYFEHKFLYRTLKGKVPSDFYTLPIGRGNIIFSGTDVTVITYGLGVHWMLEQMESFKDHSIELIDLRSLMPWDRGLVFESVKKTGKVLILHEDTLTGGIGGEISASIAEHCFEYLDAPIVRVAGKDTPVPFAKDLEKSFLPSDRLSKALNDLIRY